MAFFPEIKRSTFIPLAGLAVAAYYLLVLLPLARRSHYLDGPLQTNWQKLAASLEQTNARAIDFLRITNQLYETRQALRQLAEAKKEVITRIEMGPTVRAHMEAPFQLVDYENERSKQADALGKLAKQQGVAVDPSVFASFPGHSAVVRQPTLLWPALTLVENLLTTALRCKVAALHSLDVSLSLTNSPASHDSMRLAEVPLQLEFTGPVPNVANFLLSLPLRAE